MAGKIKKNSPLYKFYKHPSFWVLVFIFFVAGYNADQQTKQHLRKQVVEVHYSRENPSKKKSKKSKSKKFKKVTMQQYSYINVGMNEGSSLENIKNLFGDYAVAYYHGKVDGTKVTTYVWKKVAYSHSGANIAVSINKQNHAIQKSISGVKTDKVNKIDLGAYDRVTNGYSEDSVIYLLGRPDASSEKSTYKGHTKHFAYTSNIIGKPGANFVLVFTNGSVTSKNETGLEYPKTKSK